MALYKRWTKWAWCLGVALLWYWPAMAEKDEQKVFRSVAELKRMLAVARDAGFSEKEVREITLTDDQGNVINVWSYLRDIERKARLKAEQREIQRKKTYLTVQDVIADIEKDQSDDLSRLREKVANSP